MLLLISPSRVMDLSHLKKDVQSNAPLFKEDADKIAERMRGMDLEDMSRFMEEDDHMAREMLDLYQHFSSAPEKPALFAYAGKVYKAIDPMSLSADQLDFAIKHLRIISTLYGYLHPLDRIKAYRINFSLHYEDGNLYDFWKPKITPLLKKDASETGNLILNFTALNVIKAVDVPEILSESKIIHVDFKDYKKDKDEYMTIRAYAQPAKGALIGYILRNKIDGVEAVKKFKYDGYTYNQLLSDETNLVFTR
ncbi:MAG: YaaA family protein [Bacteroidales bacterium]